MSRAKCLLALTALLVTPAPAWALDAVYGSGSPTPAPSVRPAPRVVMLKVSNLPWAYTDHDLALIFGDYGDVITSRIATDRETGRSTGFGFVEMAREDAERAIQALQGAEFGGRPLKIEEAPLRPERLRR